MALVPWTDAQKQAFLKMQFSAQKASYAKEYPGARHAVICRDDDPVGRLYLDRSQERFHTLDITIANTCRDQGIGSVVLRKIVQEQSRLADQPRFMWKTSIHRCVSSSAWAFALPPSKTFRCCWSARLGL
jgi:hypothetical protein